MRLSKRGASASVKSPAGPISNTPVEHTGEIRSSTPAGEQGRGLNFLDILSDCVDYVDFHVKCDQIAHGEKTIAKEMSQKKCRFCS